MSDVITRFYINYGPQRAVAARQGLNLCILAPRYALHDLNRFNDAFFGNYNARETNELTSKPWPGRVDAASLIDLSGSKAFINNTAVRVNADGEFLTAGCTADTRNYLTFTNAVSSGNGGTLDTKLRGYDVRIGDSLQIFKSSAFEGDYDNMITAVVTRVVAGITEASATAINTVDKPDANLPTVSAASFNGHEEVKYLCTITEASTDSLTVHVDAILGDINYSTDLTVTAGATLNIGSHGVTATFTSDLTQYLINDTFYVSATPETAGAYTGVYINRFLPVDYATTELPVNVISSNIIVTAQEIPDIHWSADNTSVTVNDGIQLLLGSKVYVVETGDIYIKYRELLQAGVNEVYDASMDAVEDWVGAVHPDNPLGLCYAIAVSVGSNGFYMMPVAGETAAAYETAVGILARFEDAYSIVPWNIDIPGVADTVVTMVNETSKPETALLRMAWIGSTRNSTTVVAYEKDQTGSALIGRMTSNVLTLESGDVVAAGIVPGDTLTMYHVYNASTQTYEELNCVVDYVTGTNTVRVRSGRDQNTPVKVVFFKKTSKLELINSVIADARAYNNARVNYVWGAGFSWEGFDNLPLSAAAVQLAALRGFLPPHAPLTDVVLPGVTLTSAIKLTDSEYRKLRNNGVWALAADIDGSVATYHQVTTRVDNSIAEENSAVTNGDAIIRELRKLTMPYRGNCNATSALVDKLRGQMGAQLEAISSRVYPAIYGPQIISYSIVKLALNENVSGKIDGKFDLTLPEPYLGADFAFNLL